MGWEFQSSPRIVLNFKNSHDSRGEIITAHAFDGVRRYSMYSQVQPCDFKVALLLNAECPIVDGERLIVALGGHPFWMNKHSQGDTYTLGASASCDPTRVWMYLFNCLDLADIDPHFDAGSVTAHVRANHQSWRMG